MISNNNFLGDSEVNLIIFFPFQYLGDLSFRLFLLTSGTLLADGIGLSLNL